ncbi:hypothetical protein B0T19DRAFT_442174 [Cercophora scortea]|uniref:Uncharacterized protein n=1 Tax=Cercophora scortea TaxID=314031 RepID=A0AAE0IN58_9PEZI|nr:hypothetical protein B0T19DRAFT_442174 [Cercophora scortea]
MASSPTYKPVDELDGDGTSEHEAQPVETMDGDDSPGEEFPPRKPWATGVWTRFPFLPFTSILATVLSAVACVVVLVRSDGANTEDWQVRPSVLLGIFTAAGNASLRYALAEGFQVAWWSRATTKSHTLGRLHEYYTYGTSALAAGLSVRSPSFIAVASILTFVMVIDGPLLQRASSTVLVVRDGEVVPVRMTVAPQIPFGFTGMDFAGDHSPLTTRSLLNPGFMSVFNAYSQRQAISAEKVAAPGSCLGICDGEIEAAGLWKECNTTEDKIITPQMNGTEVEAAMFHQQLFGVDWTHATKYPVMNFLNHGYTNVSEGSTDAVPTDEPYIALNMTYSPAFANGSRSVFHKTCRLYSATCRYQIRIHNDTQQATSDTTPITTISASAANAITLTDTPTFKEGTVQNVRRSVASLGLPKTHPAPASWTDEPPLALKLSSPVSYFNNPACLQGFNCPLYETLGGIVSAAQDILAANASTTAPEGLLFLTGALANQFISAPPDTGIDSSTPPVYDIGWTDPTDYVFAALDEIVFRIAVETAHVDALQNVTWFYATLDGGVIDAPPRNGSNAETYTLRPGAQNVSMRQRRTAQVFVSNYAWLAAGMTVMFAAVAGVVPLFYGFWALGRPVSLSPVEVANAFGAPVLEEGRGGGGGGVASNATAAEIMQSPAGMVAVRYGEVAGSEGGMLRLQFEGAGRVTGPVAGRVYD